MRGIECDNITGGVTVVDLSNLFPVTVVDLSNPFPVGLSGEIRPSLMHLKSLEHLDLSSNTFGGLPIPGFFGSLTNLRYLNLSNAGFTGAVPQNLGNLSNLQYLDVSNRDQMLVVDDFRWITGLVSLKHLMMNWVDLSSVDLNWLLMLNVASSDRAASLSMRSWTLISQTRAPRVLLIPVWFWDLSFNHRGLSVSHNQLQGRLPRSFKVTPSAYLNFSFNMFEGFIPLPSVPIGVLDLSNNRFNCRIPWNITEVMPDLVFLSLSANQLTG